MPYLFFILDDSSEFLSMLASRTCDNSRITDSHIEATPQYAVDGRNGVGDVITLALPVASCDLHEQTFIELTGRNAKRCSRDLG